MDREFLTERDQKCLQMVRLRAGSNLAVRWRSG